MNLPLEELCDKLDNRPAWLKTPFESIQLGERGVKRRRCAFYAPAQGYTGQP
jgi:hypothetical protein